MPEHLNIVFAGTPDFSVPVLRALVDSPHRVVAVYTQPDRPAGRGRKLRASPVKVVAQEHRIPVHQPSSLRKQSELEILDSLGADLMVVVAYGLILPAPVLAVPTLGCVNVHASLLPRWRGAAPIHRAILAGDRETGVTIMQLDEGLDTGPMLLRKACPIDPRDTSGTLHDRLAVLGAEALMEALPGIAAGSLLPEPQDDAQACYAHKLDKAEARIDWREPAAHLDRQVRALNPWPVAQADYRGAAMRIWESAPLPEDTDLPPGTVVSADSGAIDVASGQGQLRILRLQMPGKRVMSAAEFLNAHSMRGAVLG